MMHAPLCEPHYAPPIIACLGVLNGIASGLSIREVLFYLQLDAHRIPEARAKIHTVLMINLASIVFFFWSVMVAPECF